MEMYFVVFGRLHVGVVGDLFFHVGVAKGGEVVEE